MLSTRLLLGICLVVEFAKIVVGQPRCLPKLPQMVYLRLLTTLLYAIRAARVSQNPIRKLFAITYKPRGPVIVTPKLR